MIHAGDVTYYPKARLMRHGLTLYNWRHMRLSDWFWYEFMETKSKVVCVKLQVDPDHRDCFYMVIKFSAKPGEHATVFCSPSFSGVSPVIYVWRIQRAMRRFLTSRREQQGLALAMGLHARLGLDCPINCLSSDLLALCVK